jgi:hypothetical protein
VPSESADPRFEVRRAELADFERIYDAVDDAFEVKRPREMYDWLYRKCPLGPARCWLLVEKATEVVVNVAGRVSWPLARGDQPLEGAIVADNATIPRYQRQGLGELRRPAREALCKILHGESTAPGTTHFFVYNSTMSEVLEPLYAPINLEIDVTARRGRSWVPDLVESEGNPILDPNSGDEFRAAIHLPEGFEYTTAEMGTGKTRARAGIELEGSYAQFNILHMNQDGVIR